MPAGLPAESWVKATVCATGPVDPADVEIVTWVDGVVDADADPATSPTALPTPLTDRTARTPLVRAPSLTLAKAATPAAVYADKNVVWRIGVAKHRHDDAPSTPGFKTHTLGIAAPAVISHSLGTLGRSGGHRHPGDGRAADVVPEKTLTNTATVSVIHQLQTAGHTITAFRQRPPFCSARRALVARRAIYRPDNRRWPFINQLYAASPVVSAHCQCSQPFLS
jgi:hypothetical protein